MKDFDEWLKHYRARTGRFSNTASNPLYKVNKKRRLRYGSINIPLNVAPAYRDARKENQIFVVRPLDDTAMQYALEAGLVNKAVFGLFANATNEGIILDEETGVPWQIPKVTTEYRRVDCAATKGSGSLQDTTTIEETPLSPRCIPKTVESPGSNQMDASLVHHSLIRLV